MRMPLRIMDGTGPTEATGTRGTCMMIVMIMLLRFLDVATRTAYACMMRSPGTLDAISAREDIGITEAGTRNSTKMEMASPTEVIETADTCMSLSMIMIMMSMMIMMMIRRNMQERG